MDFRKKNRWLGGRGFEGRGDIKIEGIKIKKLTKISHLTNFKKVRSHERIIH